MANVYNAQTGLFGWAMQTAKDAPNTTELEFHYAQVLSAETSVIQLLSQYDPVVGGTRLSPGSYKGGAYSAGNVRMNPALDDANTGIVGVGALFKAFAGGCAYNSGTGVGWSGSGVNIFPGVVADNHSLAKYYLTIRRMIPGDTNIGEILSNMMVASVSIDAAPGSPLNLDVTFQGGATQGATETDRLENLIEWTDPATWAASWTYPSISSSVPLTIDGTFELPQGTEYDTVNRVQITATSNLNDPRATMVIGRFSPVDYAVMNRQITISWTALWESSALIRNIIGNSPTGTTISKVVYQTSFKVIFKSANGTYMLGFYSPLVSWSTGPVQLNGSGLLTMDITGTVEDSPTGADWYFWMKNDRTVTY